MATSSFTKEFVIGEEEALRLAELLETDEPTKNDEENEIIYADEEFIRKCFV